MAENLGTNVQAEVDGDILTLKIDLSKDFGLSKSGKSSKIASTNGNKSVKHGDEDIKIGLNVYKQAE